MTIFIADKSLKSLLQVNIDKKLIGRWQFLSLIKVLKLLLQLIIDRKLMGR
jgi:hypothetical protein